MIDNIKFSFKTCGNVKVLLTILNLNVKNTIHLIMRQNESWNLKKAHCSASYIAEIPDKKMQYKTSRNELNKISDSVRGFPS